MNLTVDGCCDHTKGEGNDDMHEYHADLLREADVLLYGRKTYELMVPFWPDIARNHSGGNKLTNDFAEAFVSVKKIVVFSKTLKDVKDNNTTILRGNLEEEILKLKQEPGKSILAGGVDLPSQLVHLGLVDEYRIIIQPLIVGEGRRLFDDLRLQEKLRLKLVESKTLKSGCIASRYVKV